MTISFSDGLHYDDLLKLAHALNPVILSPELRNDLQTGVNAMLDLASAVDNLPGWLVPMLPFPPGWREKLDSVERLAQLAKGLLDA